MLKAGTYKAAVMLQHLKCRSALATLKSKHTHTLTCTHTHTHHLHYHDIIHKTQTMGHIL